MDHFCNMMSIALLVRALWLRGSLILCKPVEAVFCGEGELYYCETGRHKRLSNEGSAIGWFVRRFRRSVNQDCVVIVVVEL